MHHQSVLRHRHFILAFLFTLLVGLLFSACNRHDHTRPDNTSKSGEQKVVYHCPMHPSYTSDKPGKCPICGMELVLMENHTSEIAPDDQVKEPTHVDNRTAISIDEVRQKRIGVTTATLTIGPAVVVIRASARIAFDPELVVAQREFIGAQSAGDTDIIRASRQRLQLMGMSVTQIEELKHRGNPDDSLVLPNKSAWIYASIYEREVPFVKEGQSVPIELPEGNSIGTGIVHAIDPVLDPQTRTVRVRILLNDIADTLKPNAFVTAIIQNNLGLRLIVPKSAVIDSGTRKIVFVVHGKEHFIPKEVTLGAELSDGFVVQSGIEVGEIVATSALFLIDSESQLKSLIGENGDHQHD